MNPPETITSLPSPTDKPRVWRWEGMALAVVFGIGLILWPFMSFGAIFMFDSPIQNRSDEVGRYTVAYFIWLYPVTYAVTFIAYYILRRCGVWRVVSCLAWGFPVAAYFILSAVLTQQGQPANAGRVRLLYRTDHVALLAACREMMANRQAFTMQWEHNGGEFVSPKDPKVPAIVAALKPNAIVVSDDDVYLEVHGGFDRYGVIAFSEQTVASHTNQMSGDIQLIPGMWFIDDEYGYQQTDRAAYLNQLRAMKPEDAPEPKW